MYVTSPIFFGEKNKKGTEEPSEIIELFSHRHVRDISYIFGKKIKKGKGCPSAIFEFPDDCRVRDISYID